MSTALRPHSRRVLPDLTIALFVAVAVAACVAAGFVLGNATLLLLAAASGLVLVGGVMLWPSAATMLVMFVIYSNAAVVAVRFHGVPMAVGAAVPLLLLSPLAYYLVIRQERLRFDPVLPWIVVFIVCQMTATVFSSDPKFSTPFLITSVIEGLGLYFLVLNVVRTRRELRRVVWVLLAAGAFMGGLSVYQQATHSYGNNFGGFAQMSNAAFETGEGDITGDVEQRRLAGPFGEQNRYAQMMLMLLPLGFFRIWGEKSKPLKLLAIAASVLTAFGLALAFSRGAAVAFALMLLMMAILRYISVAQFSLMVLLALGVAVVLPAYSARLSTLSRVTKGLDEEGGGGIAAADGSVQSRYTEAVAAAAMLYDYPLTGVGPGRYPAHYREYAERVGVKVKETARQAHVLYVGLGAETGVPGLLAFLAVAVAAFRNMVRARRRAIEGHSPSVHLITGFLLAIVAYLASGFFLHFAFVRYFWLMLGLAGAAAQIALAEAPESPGRRRDSAPRTLPVAPVLA